MNYGETLSDLPAAIAVAPNKYIERTIYLTDKRYEPLLSATLILKWCRSGLKPSRRITSLIPTIFSEDLYSVVIVIAGLPISVAQARPLKALTACPALIRYRSSDNSICKTSHYITLEQLTKTVLSDVQLNVRLAAEDRAKYAKHLRKLSEIGKNSEATLCKQKSEKVSKRLYEIDMILQKMYEDRVFGVISDERYISMSKKLEAEQIELKNQLAEYAVIVEDYEKKAKGIDDFVELISQYENITELDHEIVHMLIDRIVVFGREKSDKETIQRVEIYYRFVGNISTNS